MDNVTAIIAAAGKGCRFGEENNKLLSKIDNEEIILTTFKKFDACNSINKIIITYSDCDLEYFKSILISQSKEVIFVKGGETRFQSIQNALYNIDKGIVLIHDGARPFISTSTINKLIIETKKFGTAILCSKPVNTICTTDGKDLILSSNRTKMLNAETPQCFYVDKIKKAFSFVTNELDFTDDAGVYTSFIGPCHAVINNDTNTKITFKEDITSNVRVGNGFDLHKLVENRKLILGGIEVPHTKGLLGHSDADVLTHSIMDALLSAASLRDIGYYFPDTDSKYEGIDSMVLLEKTLGFLEEVGARPISADVTIIAQTPKLSPYMEAMKEKLTAALHCPCNVKATTEEKMGFTGRKEGISAHAVVLCEVRE